MDKKTWNSFITEEPDDPAKKGIQPKDPGRSSSVGIEKTYRRGLDPSVKGQSRMGDVEATYKKGIQVGSKEIKKDKWKEYTKWVRKVQKFVQKDLRRRYYKGNNKTRLVRWLKERKVRNANKKYYRSMWPKVKAALQTKVKLSTRKLYMNHGHETDAYYIRGKSGMPASITVSVEYYSRFANDYIHSTAGKSDLKQLELSLEHDLTHEFFHAIDDNLGQAYPKLFKNKQLNYGLFSSEEGVKKDTDKVMPKDKCGWVSYERYAELKTLQTSIERAGKSVTLKYLKFLCSNKGNGANIKNPRERKLVELPVIQCLPCHSEEKLKEIVIKLRRLAKAPTRPKPAGIPSTAMAENKKWKNFLNESKLRIFDFDDTLVKTDAMVRVDTPDGKTVEMTPAEFSQHEMSDQNVYDFSDFNKVINPREIRQVTDILRNVTAAPGDREIIILTARDPAAQDAIQRWLEDIGIDTTKVNIVGLANPDPAAKANWIENKIVDGATDVLFLDDSGKNIDAVKALSRRYPNIKIDARISKYGETIEEIIKNGMETE